MVLGCLIERGLSAFTYGTSTFYGWSFQNHSASRNLCNSPILSVLGSDQVPQHPPYNAHRLKYGWV